MKLIIIIGMACTICLMSCNNEKADSEVNAEQTPSAIQDTSTTHPTGVNEGAVISTDTAAYNIENTNPDGREKLEKERSRQQ